MTANVALIDPGLINVTLQKHFITIAPPAAKHWLSMAAHTDRLTS